MVFSDGTRNFEPWSRDEDDASAGTSVSELPHHTSGQDSLVVKVSDRGWLTTSSSPVPLKTRRVGKRCTLHLSPQTSSRWCGAVVRRGDASSGFLFVT
ncbi:hypothetical protein TNCV_4482891 [Trichonephila clavipes]|nr:hypothetical protein TNCV_4482891 [Trichonephila clavipes]